MRLLKIGETIVNLDHLAAARFTPALPAALTLNVDTSSEALLALDMDFAATETVHGELAERVWATLETLSANPLSMSDIDKMRALDLLGPKRDAERKEDR